MKKVIKTVLILFLILAAAILTISYMEYRHGMKENDEEYEKFSADDSGDSFIKSYYVLDTGSNYIYMNDNIVLQCTEDNSNWGLGKILFSSDRGQNFENIIYLPWAYAFDENGIELYYNPILDRVDEKTKTAYCSIYVHRDNLQEERMLCGNLEIDLTSGKIKKGNIDMMHMQNPEAHADENPAIPVEPYLDDTAEIKYIRNDELEEPELAYLTTAKMLENGADQQEILDYLSSNNIEGIQDESDYREHLKNENGLIAITLNDMMLYKKADIVYYSTMVEWCSRTLEIYKTMISKDGGETFKQFYEIHGGINDIYIYESHIFQFMTPRFDSGSGGQTIGSLRDSSIDGKILRTVRYMYDDFYPCKGPGIYFKSGVKYIDEENGIIYCDIYVEDSLEDKLCGEFSYNFMTNELLSSSIDMAVINEVMSSEEYNAWILEEN